MTKPNDGGPAFPHMAADGHQDYRRGLSIRDWFAGQALAGLCGLGDYGYSDAEGNARAAYQFADAMLAAREPKP